MISLSKNIFFLGGAVASVIVCILFTRFNFLLIPASAFVILFSLAIIFTFYDYRIVLMLMIFSLPLSVNSQLSFSDTSIIFPSELLVGLLVLIFFLRLLIMKKSFSFDRAFLGHPLTILVLFYLAGLLFSSFFSTMPVVSWKAMMVRISYILVFYFMIHNFLKADDKNYISIFLWYGCALIVVVIYAITKHASLGLIKNYSAQSVNLFYNDHTMYSGAIAFVIPVFAALLFFPATFRIKKTGKPVIFIATLLLLTGLYLSFSRAAWVSIAVAVAILFLMLMRARFMTFIFLLAGIIVYGFFNYDDLQNSFRQNKIDSNVKNAGFYEQTRSITNITNDVSNAERLNRWSCAVRMFRDKPVTGFGIGTYQFQYFPYQRKGEMTRISVTSPYNIPEGHGGSTHSEYLLTLAESGIFSLLSFLGLLFVSLYTAIKHARSGNKKKRITIIFVFLGLVTYFIHGLFNNFLDNDKLAFLFWASLSMLATIDSSFSEKSTTL